MSIEIEIKAQCNNLADVKKRLKKLKAKFKQKTHQIDTYYLTKPNSRYQFGPRLRIRENLNSKKYFWEYHIPMGNYQAKENEVQIDNPKMAKYILKKLGFECDVVIDKIREKYQLGDINIDLDQVKGLGNFIEVEIMDKNKASSLKRIRAMLTLLGIPPENYAQYRTYLDLMWEKQGKKIIKNH